MLVMHWMHLCGVRRTAWKGRMNMTKILVTGATGTIGSQVVEQLLEAGASVRVAVRTPSKAAALEARGAEVVAYDLEKGVGVEAAFVGIERAFLLTPFVPGLEALTGRAIAAAKGSGVAHVVKLSAVGADPESEAWLPRSHGLGDVAAAESGLSYTVVRPTFFQDNVFNFSADTIRGEGTFYGASAHKPTAYVSTRDVAAVVVQALLHPEAHTQKTYDLTGGEAITDDQLAGLLSEAMGKTVTYTDVSLEQYGAALRSSGTPEPFVEAFVALENVKAQGWAATVSPHVSEVLGRAPETYAAFIARSGGRLAV